MLWQFSGLRRARALLREQIACLEIASQERERSLFARLQSAQQLLCCTSR